MRTEILTINNKELSFEASAGKIASVRDKDITKKSVRVFREGKILSSSFVGDISNDQLLEKTLSNDESAIAFDYELDSIKEIEQVVTTKSKTEKDFYNDYDEALSILTENHPDFIFSGSATWNKHRLNTHYINECEQNLLYDHFTWYFLYKHRNSQGIMDGFLGEEQIATFDIASQCKKYSNFLKVYDHEVSLPSGNIPVVFAESSILLTKLLESMRADNYHQGIGLFNNRLGDKILSDRFSLYDLSFDPRECAMKPFDAEGFSRDEVSLSLVKNGVFNNIIADARNAKKYSVTNTGNGQRSFDSNTALAFNTVRVGRGKQSSSEILQTLDRCIYVELASGGDFTDSGDYSTPVQSGYLLENGVPKGRIPQITLNTSIEKMFGDDLIEIANDPFTIHDNNPAVFMTMNMMVN